jgi:hypothetical protein
MRITRNNKKIDFFDKKRLNLLFFLNKIIYIYELEVLSNKF